MNQQANTSSNETTYSMTLGLAEKIEMAYLLLFFFIGTPINLYAFWRQYGILRRTSGNESRLIRLSLHLIIANMWVLCVWCVWRTYWFTNIVWTDGDLMCKLYSFLSTYPFQLWSNMVAAIAIDMLVCIRKPLSSYRTGSRRVNALIWGAWLTAIVPTSPMLFIRGTIPIPSTPYEQCYHLVDKFAPLVLVAYNWVHVISVFYVPLLVVVVCYAFIGLALRRQMGERRKLMETGRTENATARSIARHGSVAARCAHLKSVFINRAAAASTNDNNGDTAMTTTRAGRAAPRNAGTICSGEFSAVDEEAEPTTPTTPSPTSTVRIKHRNSIIIGNAANNTQQFRRDSGVSSGSGLTRPSRFAIARASVGSLVSMRSRRLLTKTSALSQSALLLRASDRRQVATKNRFLRVTIAIILTYTLSWLPYQVSAVLSMTCDPDSRCMAYVKWFSWVEAMMISSACINPFLYRFKSRPQQATSSGGCGAAQALTTQQMTAANQTLRLQHRRPLANRRQTVLMESSSITTSTNAAPTTSTASNQLRAASKRRRTDTWVTSPGGKTPAGGEKQSLLTASSLQHSHSMKNEEKPVVTVAVSTMSPSRSAQLAELQG